MAVNMYIGGKGGSAPKAPAANSASQSDRAKAAQAALSVPSVTSDSGSTAVGSKGVLGKIGSFVKDVAGPVLEMVPGPVGSVAKLVGKVLGKNDPEWWQSVPGDAVTLNQGLQPINNEDQTLLRQAIVQIIDGAQDISLFNEGVEYTGSVILPTQQQITQYLLPQVRKVVNAVPLQHADDYRIVLCANATLYALWRHAKKMKYMLTHGQTYLPSMNDVSFPLFQTENSAYLDALINRLEEYLRANVRLPHTLCEYLAWRYGRVYKTSNSLKASLVIYAPIPDGIAASKEAYNDLIERLMALPSSTKERQAANSDLYNTYFDHDLMVEIKDETQFWYDPKEFALRTNCDLSNFVDLYADTPNFVFLDSALDNPTAFMASTISTHWKTNSGSTRFTTCLMPVHKIQGWMYVPSNLAGTSTLETPDVVSLYMSPNDFGFSITDDVGLWRRNTDSNWMHLAAGALEVSSNTGADAPTKELIQFLNISQFYKANEIYNKDLRIAVFGPGEGKTDVSAPNYDLACVQDFTIQQEQVYAFANLVDIGRKHSLSYKAAEKLVSKEAANLIEKLDVGAVATPAPAAPK